MNHSYATLKTYNEVMISDNEIQEAYPNLNDFHLFETNLNKDNLCLNIITNGNSKILIIYDVIKKILFFNIELNNIYNIISCGIYILNEQDEMDQLILEIFNKTEEKNLQKIISFSQLKFDLELFFKLIMDEKIVICINTESYPNGEIVGFIKLIY